MMISRQHLFNVLEIEAPDGKVTNRFERFMFVLVILNVVISILETVNSIRNLMGPFLYLFDVFSLVVFTGEYLARVWVCTLDKRYSSFFWGRLKYMLTPYMLLDLAIIAPFYLPLFFDIDTRFILVFRMLRIARVLKLTRYSQSFQRLMRVTVKKKDDLIAILGIGMVALPTGIIGSGFLEEINCKTVDSRCPHCGKSLDG